MYVVEMLFLDEDYAAWAWRMDPIGTFDPEGAHYPCAVLPDEVAEWWEWWQARHYLVSVAAVPPIEGDMYRWQITDNVALELKMQWM